MRKKNIIPVLAIVFAATAALLSYHLLAVHLDGAPRPAWFDAGCSEDSSLGSDCAAVLASPYSYWPPKTTNETEERPHVPVAFLGLLYYSVLTVWLVGIGRVSFRRRFWHLLPMAIVAFGLLGSANFVTIMFTKIDEWCIWCLVTHGLNLLIGMCLVLMWPRRSAPVPPPVAHDRTSSETEAEPEPAFRSPHPSGRLIVTTLLAAWLALFGLVQFYGRTTLTKKTLALKAGFEQCVDTIKNIAADGGALLAMWQSGAKQEIPIRSDDPVWWPNGQSVRTGSSAPRPLEAVVFSDFECPSCKRLARFLQEDVQPLFDGRLRLVFKHFPLNRNCNPTSTTQMHKHACDGAAMVEAARILGGVERFWKAHDFVFAQQARLKRGTLSVDDVAAAIGVDASRLKEAMLSDAVTKRISEDATTGSACGVRATPALFVSGKLVRIPARGDIRFWDALADQYWRSVNETRPASTMLPEQPEAAP